MPLFLAYAATSRIHHPARSCVLGGCLPILLIGRFLPADYTDFTDLLREGIALMIILITLISQMPKLGVI